jgi:hypothetical protein
MSFRFLVVVDKSPDAMSGDFFVLKAKKTEDYVGVLRIFRIFAPCL